MRCRHAYGETGSALIIVMIMVVVLMGTTISFIVISQKGALDSEQQVEFLSIHESAEVGINMAIKQVISTRIEENRNGEFDPAKPLERLGFVGLNLDANRPDTRTITGAVNGIAYTAHVRSAFFAYKYGTAEGTTFLREVTTAERNDTEDPGQLFDIYEIIAYSATATEVGEQYDYNYKRGVRLVVEVSKINVVIPSALYINDDPDPAWNGSSWRVSGRDHSMLPNGGASLPSLPGSQGALAAFRVAPPSALICAVDRELGTLLLIKAAMEMEARRRDNGWNVPRAIAGADGGGGGGGGGGQLNEGDYLTNSGDDKGGVGYNGDLADALVGVNDPATQVQGDPDLVQTEVNLRELAAAFLGSYSTDPLVPDPTRSTTISGVTDGNIGDINNFQVTYLKVTGPKETIATPTTGGGVLIIDGNLKISGTFTFYGIIIVLGDLEIAGGGNGTHIFGSVMSESQSDVSGQADIWWSQEAINRAMTELDPTIYVQVAKKSWSSLDKAQLQNMGF